jgi:C4-dicarboxylate-specific signal transduction histidine kinase
MTIERPQRRMTLRQLLTHSEKIVRDLIEHLNTVVLPREVDFRDLSRPVRRRSHYPTVLALHNALHKLLQADIETQALSDYLLELLQEIREHARRERINRR